MNLPSSVTSGSTLSRQSTDLDGSESTTSTANTSIAAQSIKSKKKRYAKQHQPQWLEEGQPSDPSLRPSPAPTDHNTLPTLPPNSRPMQPPASAARAPRPQPQPQIQTLSPAGSTISPALSILGSRKYAQISPGHDAPAVHPGKPSAYLAAFPPGQNSTQSKEIETADDNALSAIDEEKSLPERSPSQSPSQQSSQPEMSKLRRGLSKLLRRGK